MAALGSVRVHVAVPRSSAVQPAAKLLLAHVPGVLRLPTVRAGAWWLGWASLGWANLGWAYLGWGSADSHLMFSATVHKKYVCSTDCNGAYFLILEKFNSWWNMMNFSQRTHLSQGKWKFLSGNNCKFCKLSTLKWMRWNYTSCDLFFHRKRHCCHSSFKAKQSRAVHNWDLLYRVRGNALYWVRQHLVWTCLYIFVWATPEMKLEQVVSYSGLGIAFLYCCTQHSPVGALGIHQALKKNWNNFRFQDRHDPIPTIKSSAGILNWWTGWYVL